MPEENNTPDEHGSFEKVVIAAVGAITKTVEAAGEVLEELIKKGEDFFQHGKAVNEELKHKKKETESEEVKSEEMKGE